MKTMPIRNRRFALIFANLIMLVPLASNLIGDSRLLKLKLKERDFPFYEVNSYFRITPPSLEWYNIMQLHVQVMRDAGADDVILSRKPNLCSMLSKRRCMGIPRSNDPQEILRLIDGWGVDYVVMDEYHIENHHYLRPAILARSDGFQEIFHIPGTDNMVFKVISRDEIPYQPLP